MSSQQWERNQAATLPRLLLGVDAERALSLQEHISIHGPLPAVEASRGDGRRDRHSPGRSPGRGSSRDRIGRLSGINPLIEEVERADLRGRGGASFPLAAKLRAVLAARSGSASGARSGSDRPIVVVNATEGEPASMKDRLLLKSLPHLVLDGADLAGKALDADRCIVCVCESDGNLRSIERAIAERRGLEDRVKMSFSVVRDGYVTGEESALVHHLNGGPALPTFTPPMPFERGVEGRPTLISNAETLAHLALIARNGAMWYRQLGTSSQPGSTLVTLSGPLANPGVYEIEHGASLSSLVQAAGGLLSSVRAALLGGYSGTWIDGGVLHEVALCDEQLAPLRASVGAGVIALLSAEACPIAETARLMQWLASQSARQCGPCFNGLHAIATTFAAIASGTTRQGESGSLNRLIALTRGRGACRHPDGAVRLVQSAIEVFSQELANHARDGACEACHRRCELPLPAWSNPTHGDSARRKRGVRGGGVLHLGARA